MTSTVEKLVIYAIFPVSNYIKGKSKDFRSSESDMICEEFGEYFQDFFSDRKVYCPAVGVYTLETDPITAPIRLLSSVFLVSVLVLWILYPLL